MCVSSTVEVMVSMYSGDIRNYQTKVVFHSGSTEKKNPIQFDNKGEPLLSDSGDIKYIIENRNHDISVADCGAGAIVVVNQDGKFMGRYIGYPTATKNKPCKPYAITAVARVVS